MPEDLFPDDESIDFFKDEHDIVHLNVKNVKNIRCWNTYQTVFVKTVDKLKRANAFIR